MYLVSLNNDYFFKKTFSDPEIAQAFFEDILNVKIESIEKLPTDHKVTDAAALIKFDYRCKINGQYVILEMQQGRKSDVVKRFYIYHGLSTCLQLETLKEVISYDLDGNELKLRNYSELERVITIIWMVVDNFGLEDDFAEFNMYNKLVYDFVANDDIWGKQLKDLLEIREKLLKTLQTKKRGLDFLSQNRFIFAFQQNIIKNKKYAKYVRWFEFAEKTRNVENQEADFAGFNNDLIFSKMMARLTTTTQEPEDLRKAMGDIAYEAAKKRGEAYFLESLKEELRDQIEDEWIRKQDSTHGEEIRRLRATYIATAVALEESRVAQDAAKELAQIKEQVAENATKKAAATELLLQEAKKELAAERKMQRQQLKEEKKRAALEEKKRAALEAKKRAEEDRKRAEEDKKRLHEIVKALAKSGFSIEAIAQMTFMTHQVIEQLLKNQN
jgi:hypothetical protein